MIFHGIGDSPQSYWIPYVKEKLEEKGYTVWTPQLPQSDRPALQIQVPFVLKQGTFTSETVMIGHSSGVPLILGVLEQLPGKVKQVIGVSGFVEVINPQLKELIKVFSWEKIRVNAQEFFFINSDNDPWGATDRQGRLMLDHLGGTQIIRKGEGHMGSDTYHQPYKEFPFLLKLID